MPGKFVISLDFELMWGVRDKRSIAGYGDAVLNVRSVIPAMLERFSRFGIRATWATVGLLFCRSREEMLAYSPSLRPEYRHPGLSPYYAIETEVGLNEAEDPYHFGRSLIDAVVQTEGQEVATHTFSHFCCLEDGHSPEAFDKDLEAARYVAEDAGHVLRSIVFPRNQYAAKHLDICRKNGLHAFRGNPRGFAYRPRKGDDNSLLVRSVRLLDSVAPVSPRSSFKPMPEGHAFSDIPASRFLRPVATRAPVFSKLHVARIVREMQVAARCNEVYHLWWHPHNMGRQTRQNLAQLDVILDLYCRLAESHGFSSVNMSDLSAQAIEKPGQHTPLPDF